MYEYDASFALPGTITHCLNEYKEIQRRQAKKTIRNIILKHNMANSNKWPMSRSSYVKLTNLDEEEDEESRLRMKQAHAMKELEVFRRFDFDRKTEETNVRGLKNEIATTTCSETIITKEILRRQLNIKFTFIILGILLSTAVYLALLSIGIHHIEDDLFSGNLTTIARILLTTDVLAIINGFISLGICCMIDKFKDAVEKENYYNNPSLRSVIDTIHTNFKCCGFRNYLVWKDTSDDGLYPTSCCSESYSASNQICLKAQRSAFGRGNLTNVIYVRGCSMAIGNSFIPIINMIITTVYAIFLLLTAIFFYHTQVYIVATQALSLPGACLVVIRYLRISKIYLINGTEILGKVANRIIKEYIVNNIELEAGPNSPRLQTVVSILDKDLNSHRSSTVQNVRERSASILSKTPQINQAKLVTNLLLDPVGNGEPNVKRKLSRALGSRTSFRRPSIRKSDSHGIRFLPKNPPVRQFTNTIASNQAADTDDIQITNVESGVKVSIDGRSKKLLNKDGKVYFVSDSEQEQTEKGSDRTAESLVDVGGDKLKKIHKGSKLFYIEEDKESLSVNNREAKKHYYCKEMRLTAEGKSEHKDDGNEKSIDKLTTEIQKKFQKSLNKYVKSLCMLDPESQACKDARINQQLIIGHSATPPELSDYSYRLNNKHQRIPEKDDMMAENSVDTSVHISIGNSEHEEEDHLFNPHLPLYSHNNTSDEIEDEFDKGNEIITCKRKRKSLNWNSKRTFRCSNPQNYLKYDNLAKNSEAIRKLDDQSPSMDGQYSPQNYQVCFGEEDSERKAAFDEIDETEDLINDEEVDIEDEEIYDDEGEEDKEYEENFADKEEAGQSNREENRPTIKLFNDDGVRSTDLRESDFPGKFNVLIDYNNKSLESKLTAKQFNLSPSKCPCETKQAYYPPNNSFFNNSLSQTTKLKNFEETNQQKELFGKSLFPDTVNRASREIDSCELEQFLDRNNDEIERDYCGPGMYVFAVEERKGSETSNSVISKPNGRLESGTLTKDLQSTNWTDDNRGNFIEDISLREKSVSSSSYDNLSPNKMKFDWIITDSTQVNPSNTGQNNSAINCSEFATVQDCEINYDKISGNRLPSLYLEDNNHFER
ncbi:DgyrCDS5163 [Dimorphilus gyrociliatus]|uniref:DgyrCDS5163 n=1 Tax=Dimorphilus gyrociliatus TaxID=2664684 RepID=A0A7I8VJ07_9ANNE|nr:DgyrCDS5163 [Dimorphilus gyrociliatus]